VPDGAIRCFAARFGGEDAEERVRFGNVKSSITPAIAKESRRDRLRNRPVTLARNDATIDRHAPGQVGNASP